eukprot:gene12010-biopygen3397
MPCNNSSHWVCARRGRTAQRSWPAQVHKDVRQAYGRTSLCDTRRRITHRAHHTCNPAPPYPRFLSGAADAAGAGAVAAGAAPARCSAQPSPPAAGAAPARCSAQRSPPAPAAETGQAAWHRSLPHRIKR